MTAGGLQSVVHYISFGSVGLVALVLTIAIVRAAIQATRKRRGGSSPMATRGL